MSKFLVRQQNEITEKYLQFCERFGVEPLPNYKKNIEDSVWQVPRKRYQNPNADRKEALAIYLKRCSDFNVPIQNNIDEASTGDLWRYIIRDTDVVINAEFSKEFEKITDISLKHKIIGVIQTLYDEGLYVKKAQTTNLFACSNNDELIYKEYEKLGGKEKLLALDDIDYTIDGEECDEEEYKEEEEEREDDD